ncbi:FeoC-like transcriptional regulator [Pleomorphomonas sp. PLEO]|uniref:FeoC-like transcriptional regulator n=1 Tax=Pleomorphomonas sp. PLEO TaxID=3239306 RepID=UPI00351F596C
MMTPSTVRDYLRERGRAPLTDVALHFDAGEDAVRAALGLWIAKGKVRALAAGAGCSKAGTCGCACKVEEIFEWVGERQLAS